MSVPSSTYRLQLGPEFGFSAAASRVDYLSRLGISTVYLSPILAARKGSVHGYDVVDPTQLNPELGTLDEFRALCDELRRHDMGLLLDIVPNHMAMSHESPWWVDTLAKGRQSPHARVFDIDWEASPLDVRGRVLLPVLGKPLAEVVSAGELSLKIDENRFWLSYFENLFPLSWNSVLCWFRVAAQNAESGILQLVDAFRIDAGEDALGKEILGAHQNHDSFRRFVETLAREADRGQIERLLNEQHYRLAYWRTAVDEINYRRFFTIAHLIGVNVDDPWVFVETHRLILELVSDGLVNGLRIDHIDGLAYPERYLVRLREELNKRAASDEPAYVIVEKILCGDEVLPENWPVAGTSGYEFLDRVNRVFIEPQGLEALRTTYEDFVGSARPYTDVRYDKKVGAVDSLFPGELARLAAKVKELAAGDPTGRDVSLNQFTMALRELTVCLDVYRTYLSKTAASDSDEAVLDRAFEAVRRRNPLVDEYALQFVRRILTAQRHSESEMEVVIRWQQLSGPVMAKGLEDTTHYSYFPLASLNDVGSEADHPALSVDDFHRWNAERFNRGEQGLNATSTHDTKRGEDVRARLNVLSEIAEEWERSQLRWHDWTAPKRVKTGDVSVPDPVLETLIYQTLLGVWPLEEHGAPDTAERVKDYLVKASRERKEFTRWIAIDAGYEEAIHAFVDAILDASDANRFMDDFRNFHRRIAHAGHLNALSQLVLKIASPGVPDIYRGTELWDLSLVDPDNRRPFSFEERDDLLRGLDEELKKRPKSLLRNLNVEWTDGRIKLFITAQALRYRRAHASLFLEGSYRPLYASRGRRENVCAFARQLNGHWAIAVAPISIAKRTRSPLGRTAWGEDVLFLESGMPKQWRNVLTDQTLSTKHPGEPAIALHCVLRYLPVALLVSENTP